VDGAELAGQCARREPSAGSDRRKLSVALWRDVEVDLERRVDRYTRRSHGQLPVDLVVFDDVGPVFDDPCSSR
jgi:hypothetical protein